MNKQRFEFLDLLKCLGMYIVVSSHIHTRYGWFSLPLHCFVIPLYFFLSGLTFKASKFNSFGEFFKHRCKTLLLPYALLSLVTWLVWAGYNVFSGGMPFSSALFYPLFQTLIAQGSGGFLVHNVPLWFIPCLFCIEMMYYFIDKCRIGINVAISSLLAIVGAFMITGPYSQVLKLLPWSLESAFAALIFYCVGNILTKKISLARIQEFATSNRWIIDLSIIVLFPIQIFSAHYNGHISLGSDLLGVSPFLFYLNAFIGIATIFAFSLIVCSLKWESPLWKKIMNFQLWFGRNSFYIMATHVPIKGILMVILAKLLGKTVTWVSLDIISCIIVFIITCILSSFAAILINKLKEHDHKVWLSLTHK